MKITEHATAGYRSLLTLDPGIRNAGIALFRGPALILASVVKNPETSGNGPLACVRMAQRIVATVGCEVDEILVEWPQVYATRIRQGVTREDPNDLIPLAGVGCALGAMYPRASLQHVRPAEWKGQVPGDAFTARILGRLAQIEVERLASTLRTDPILHTDRIAALMKHSTAHNAIDAVGLGLYKLGRLHRERVIAR